jgi:hypothetical protein
LEFLFLVGHAEGRQVVLLEDLSVNDVLEKEGLITIPKETVGTLTGELDLIINTRNEGRFMLGLLMVIDKPPHEARHLREMVVSVPINILKDVPRSRTRFER